MSLVDNLLPYLSALGPGPPYRFDGRRRDDVERIVSWWQTAMDGPKRRTRLRSIVDRIAQHTLSRPVKHGARVTLPPDAAVDLSRTAGFG